MPLALSGGAILPALFSPTVAGAATPASTPAAVSLTQPGQVAAVGAAPALGSPGSAAHDPVGIARTPSGKGYWVVGADGGVYSYGDATFYGGEGSQHLNAPIVGIAATPSGHGYWLVASDGGIFTFGDATFYGSEGSQHLNAPIVGIAATPTGHGYWLVASDGGIFTFGDAAFYGSEGSQHLNAPIVGIAATPTGQGYWLAGSDGGIFTFGDAAFHGSLPAQGMAAKVSAITGASGGQGYWLADTTGRTYAYGAATDQGSASTTPATDPIVAMAATLAGTGYWELSGQPPAQQTASSVPTGTPLGSFSITCYSGYGTTYSGAPTGMDDVAVDPRVIPIGAKIWIDGVGQRTALDTGSAIIGARLDLWLPTNGQCDVWGRQSRSVTLLSS